MSDTPNTDMVLNSTSEVSPELHPSNTPISYPVDFTTLIADLVKYKDKEYYARQSSHIDNNHDSR